MRKDTARFASCLRLRKSSRTIPAFARQSNGKDELLAPGDRGEHHGVLDCLPSGFIGVIRERGTSSFGLEPFREQPQARSGTRRFSKLQFRPKRGEQSSTPIPHRFSNRAAHGFRRRCIGRLSHAGGGESAGGIAPTLLQPAIRRPTPVPPPGANRILRGRGGRNERSAIQMRPVQLVGNARRRRTRHRHRRLCFEGAFSAAPSWPKIGRQLRILGIA